MPKISEGQYALGTLTFIAVWLLVVLPLLYRPAQQAPQVHARQQADSALKGEKNAKGWPQQTAKANEEYGGNHSEQGENEGTEFWPPVFGYRLKVTDTLVTVFTALLFFATLALWLSTRALVRGAEDTAERQLRAYVFLDGINLRRFDISDKTQWNIQIAWKNTGGTRTRRFVAKVSHDLLDLSKQPLETFDFHDELDAQTFHGLIGPNQSVNPPPIPVADIHVFSAFGDDMALLIWGWAEYQDVFSDATHRTEFGFRVWIEGNILGKSLIRFEPTEKHNAADDDCMKPPMSPAARQRPMPPPESQTLTSGLRHPLAYFA
jgi:hypothetical protein